MQERVSESPRLPQLRTRRRTGTAGSARLMQGAASIAAALNPLAALALALKLAVHTAGLSAFPVSAFTAKGGGVEEGVAVADNERVTVAVARGVTVLLAGR